MKYTVVILLVVLLLLIGTTVSGQGLLPEPDPLPTIQPTPTVLPTPLPRWRDIIDFYTYEDIDGLWLVEEQRNGITKSTLLEASSHYISKQEPTPTPSPDFDCEAKIAELEIRIANLEKRLGIK